MRTKGIMIGALLLAAMLLLAACGSGNAGPTNGSANNSPDNSNSAGSDGIIIDETEPVRLFERAEVVQKQDGSWLIAAYVEQAGSSFVDASSMQVTADTLLEDSEGNTLTADDIQVGATVEVWNIGPVMESYPTQTKAARIVLHSEEDGADGSITRADAVHAALQSVVIGKEATFPLAVKSASLDADSGYWQVELIEAMNPDEPIPLRIDAESGEPLPIPVAENDAFRVYLPEPESSPEPGFVVRGEARVFEAAFSWQLEDGHAILAEGNETASAGGPEWGSFEFTVPYEVVSQPNMMLILFVYSAKDGSQEHQLIIPLKAPEDLIRYSVDLEQGEVSILPVGSLSE